MEAFEKRNRRLSGRTLSLPLSHFHTRQAYTCAHTHTSPNMNNNLPLPMRAKAHDHQYPSRAIDAHTQPALRRQLFETLRSNEPSPYHHPNNIREKYPTSVRTRAGPDFTSLGCRLQGFPPRKGSLRPRGNICTVSATRRSASSTSTGVPDQQLCAYLLAWPRAERFS